MLLIEELCVCVSVHADIRTYVVAIGATLLHILH